MWLAPFAATSAGVWGMLRQESSVELGPIMLAGAGPQRKVALDVTIDGVPGSALSVMSQGELHALGLARVLSFMAATRQVVVFTHDDRLPAALRQLQLPSKVLAVTRRERSVVSVRAVAGPVKRYLDDGRALEKTVALPQAVRAVAVAGLCRGAVEAACVDVVRARDLGRGMPHDVVKQSLESASHSLQDMVALALFGTVSRAVEVPAGLKALGGPACMNAFWDAKAGVHDPKHGDLKRLIDETERLAEALRR